MERLVDYGKPRDEATDYPIPAGDVRLALEVLKMADNVLRLQEMVRRLDERVARLEPPTYLRELQEISRIRDCDKIHRGPDG